MAFNFVQATIYKQEGIHQQKNFRRKQSGSLPKVSRGYSSAWLALSTSETSVQRLVQLIRTTEDGENRTLKFYPGDASFFVFQGRDPSDLQNFILLQLQP